MKELSTKDISWSKRTIFFLFFICLFLLFWDHRWTKGDIIVWDIWSYYAYLPVVFLEQDLKMTFLDDQQWKILIYYAPSHLENGNWLIKTTMGMSIIYLPYFLIGHLWALIHSGMNEGGFSQPYQIMIALSGPVNLLIGLLALRKVMLSYFTETVTALSMIFIVLGTNALHYTYNEGAMSHIHNFMLFSLFMRLTQLWHDNPTWKRTVLISLLSGFIALVRPNNGIIGLFFIFYNVYDLKSLKQKLQLFWKLRLKLLILPFIAISVWIPQFCYWKYITGHWMFNSYIGERFFFDRPRFYYAMFSYTKGWMVYTPMAAFGLIGLFLMGKAAKQIRFAVPIFMLLNIYIVFSWWCWWYGGGYSQRALIDSYPILALAMAAFLTFIFKSKIAKYTVMPIMFLLLALSLFQTWQYNVKIIHWEATTKELYWTVFLKTKHPKNYQELLHSVNYEAAMKGEVKYFGEK